MPQCVICTVRSEGFEIELPAASHEKIWVRKAASWQEAIFILNESVINLFHVHHNNIVLVSMTLEELQIISNLAEAARAHFPYGSHSGKLSHKGS